MSAAGQRAGSGTARFRRLVLELGHGADPATMRQAAAFARLLDAELHALFVEDETLLHASALPFVREISPLSFQWRPMAPDRLESELRSAAERARRSMMETARTTGVRQSFEIRRGDLALHITEICVESDIVVVTAMGHETTLGFHRLRETACRSVASVLFLPPVAPRRRGVVVAVAADPIPIGAGPTGTGPGGTGPTGNGPIGAGDPGIEVARRIAGRGRERLLVLAPPMGPARSAAPVGPAGGAVKNAGGSGGMADRSGTSDGMADHAGAAGGMAAGPGGARPGTVSEVRVLTGGSAQDIMAAIGDTRETLIVLTRGGLADGENLAAFGAELSTGRGVPVLIVEPG
jgi:hypothetical protein